MASGSLAFQHRPDLEADLTKFGFLVYAGDVRNFHEWEFRAMTRWNQTKDDERKDLASKFLDSLRGEAYIAAEDLGTEILFNKDNKASPRSKLRKVWIQGEKGREPKEMDPHAGSGVVSTCRARHGLALDHSSS